MDASSEIDLEHWSYSNRDMGDHTKMSLARQLQARDNLSDAARNRAYSLPKATLLAMIRAGPGVAAAAALAAYPPAPPAGPVPGRGARGRGGAKGKGKVPAVGGRAAGRGRRGKGGKG